MGGGPRTGLELGGHLVAGLPTPLERSLSTTTDMDPLESPSSRTVMGSVGCDEIAPSPGGIRDDPDAVILDDNGEEMKGKRACTQNESFSSFSEASAKRNSIIIYCN